MKYSRPKKPVSHTGRLIARGKVLRSPRRTFPRSKAELESARVKVETKRQFLGNVTPVFRSSRTSPEKLFKLRYQRMLDILHNAKSPRDVRVVVTRPNDGKWSLAGTCYTPESGERLASRLRLYSHVQAAVVRPSYLLALARQRNLIA